MKITGIIELCTKKKIFKQQHKIVNMNIQYSRHKITLEVPVVFGDARDVMGVVAGNGHGDTSSNPGRG